MKKNMMRVVIAIAIMLVTWSILSFVIPFAHTAPFWIGYVLGVLAILVQLPIILVSFGRGQNLRSRLYGFPIAHIGCAYLVVQLVLSLVAMAVGALFPIWLLIVLETLLIAATALGLLSTTAMRDEIQRQDTVLQANVSCMRALQSKAAALLGQTQDQQVLPLLKQLSEELRYSDPVSSAATSETEANLTICIDDIEKTLVDDDMDSVAALCKKASALLTERNRLCKLNK